MEQAERREPRRAQPRPSKSCRGERRAGLRLLLLLLRRLWRVLRDVGGGATSLGAVIWLSVRRVAPSALWPACCGSRVAATGVYNISQAPHPPSLLDHSPQARPAARSWEAIGGPPAVGCLEPLPPPPPLHRQRHCSLAVARAAPCALGWWPHKRPAEAPPAWWSLGIREPLDSSLPWASGQIKKFWAFHKARLSAFPHFPLRICAGAACPA